MFTLACLGFFWLNGHQPVALFREMVLGAFGDGYALSETLVKATPILFCALAVALPARLGLISVGGDGQLYFGALTGTAVILALGDLSAPVMLPLMLLGAAAGGALWGALAGALRARIEVNETISTLLLNYIAVLLVDYAVHGPWKDQSNLGWPATSPFPAGAILPTFFDTRVHLGLLLAVIAAVLLYIFASRSRWGLGLTLLRSNQRVGRGAGINYPLNVLLVMGIGGALAGLAGIAEASVIQGRLQGGLSAGYGISGFLVAWLAGQKFLLIIPLAVLMGGLQASADSLQLFAQMPSSSAVILQGILFAIVLAVGGRWRERMVP
ncbi:MAG: ABC transporter permease [Gammaproteobacteria bacterium]|nr:ABC transporter permease [Gammaproteobacteria bacterium]